MRTPLGTANARPIEANLDVNSTSQRDEVMRKHRLMQDVTKYRNWVGSMYDGPKPKRTYKKRTYKPYKKKYTNKKWVPYKKYKAKRSYKKK